MPSSRCKEERRHTVVYINQKVIKTVSKCIELARRNLSNGNTCKHYLPFKHSHMLSCPPGAVPTPSRLVRTDSSARGQNCRLSGCQEPVSGPHTSPPTTQWAQETARRGAGRDGPAVPEAPCPLPARCSGTSSRPHVPAQLSTQLGLSALSARSP